MEQNRELRKTYQYIGKHFTKVLCQLKEVRIGYLINNAIITIKSQKENKSRRITHKIQSVINCTQNEGSKTN